MYLFSFRRDILYVSNWRIGGGVDRRKLKIFYLLIIIIIMIMIIVVIIAECSASGSLFDGRGAYTVCT